jgi:hypothetical protein
VATCAFCPGSVRQFCRARRQVSLPAAVFTAVFGGWFVHRQTEFVGLLRLNRSQPNVSGLTSVGIPAPMTDLVDTSLAADTR